MDWSDLNHEEPSTAESSEPDPTVATAAALNDQTLIGEPDGAEVFEPIGLDAEPVRPPVTRPTMNRALTPEPALAPVYVPATSPRHRGNGRIKMMPVPKVDMNNLRINCNVCFNNAGASGECCYPCPKHWPKHQTPMAVATPWPPTCYMESAIGLNTALLTFRTDGDQLFGQNLYFNADLELMTVNEFCKLKLKVAFNTTSGPTIVSDREWLLACQSVANTILVPKSWAKTLPIIREFSRRVKNNNL